MRRLAVIGLGAATAVSCGGAGAPRVDGLILNEHVVEDPDPETNLPIDALAADESLSEDLRAFLAQSVETAAAEGETRPGSYEPLLAIEPDRRQPSSGAVLTAVHAGNVSGSVVVANPANRAFRASLLCLRAFTAVSCRPDQELYRVDLLPGAGSLLPFRIDVRDGDEISFVLLVDDDLVDPLPASASITEVAGTSWDEWDRRFPDGTSATPAADCGDGITFRAANPPRPGHAVRGDDLDVVVSPCEPIDVVPLLFANRNQVIRPDSWPAGGVTVGGATTWRVPSAVTGDPDVETLQSVLVRFNPTGGSDDGYAIVASAAEELVLDG